MKKFSKYLLYALLAIIDIAVVYYVITYWNILIPLRHNRAILLWSDGMFVGFFNLIFLSIITLGIVGLVNWFCIEMDKDIK